MQIGAISETASSTTHWSSAQSRPAASSSFAAVQQSALATEPESSAPSVVQIQNSAASAQVATIAASYSTTVAGTSYAASVEESGGTYTASVPMPPGLSASGSSIESAENNLNIILDTLA